MSQTGRYSGKPTGGNPGFSSSVKNGRIPQNLLRRLETQPQMPEEEQWLWPAAALGLDAMAREAKSDGVSIRLHEAYRTYARQLYFWKLYQSGQGNLAARPGTSNHGWATAIDVDRGHDTHALPWMRIHAVRHGWDLPDELGRREPWHWQWIKGHPAGATLPEEQETKVYVHGELVPHAYAGNPTGEAVLVFLRPVAEALDWDIVDAEKRVASLTDGKRLVEIEYEATGDGRALVAARLLAAKVGVPVHWDGKAVRIG